MRGRPLSESFAGSEELFDHVLGKDRNREADDELTTAHLTMYKQHWGRLQALPGATDLLRTCAARGLAPVLASSAKDEELAALRSVLDADHVISAATSSNDADSGKPHPDILQAALDAADLKAGDAIFVGDAVWDGKAAARTGLPFIGLECGGTSEAELRTAGAVAVYRDPAHLLDDMEQAFAALLSR